MIHYYSKIYEISPLTMAVVSEVDKNGRRMTRVLEEKNEFLTDVKPLEIIQQSCKFFGSSLKGRQEGTAAVSGITYKAPISIDPSIGLYFFPTHSPANLKCSWISHTHIDSIHQTDNKKTEIIFKNKKSIFLDTSYGSMLNQVQRTAQFRYLMETRLHQMRQKGDIAAESPRSTPPKLIPPFYGSRD